MQNLIIISNIDIDYHISPILRRMNEIQDDFLFNILPISKNEIDEYSLQIDKDIKGDDYFYSLSKLKLDKGYKEKDLVIFYSKGILSSKKGTNLFRRTKDETDEIQGVSIISYRFLQNEVLESNIDFKKISHALFHFILNSVIGTYTNLKTHFDDKGCVRDYCNYLRNINRKLDENNYCLCRECKNELIKSNYHNPILKMIEHTSEIYGERRILVLGAYGDGGMKRIAEICRSIEKRNFTPIVIKDIRDDVYKTNIQKIVFEALQADFVICEYSIPGGEIAELQKLSELDIIISVVHEENKGATHMLDELFYRRLNIERRIYKKLEEIDSIIDESIKWALKTRENHANDLNTIYNWRMDTMRNVYDGLSIQYNQ